MESKETFFKIRKSIWGVLAIVRLKKENLSIRIYVAGCPHQ